MSFIMGFCFACRTSGIALDLSQLSWSSTRRSKRSSTSSDSEYRSGLTSHVYCVASDRFVVFESKLFDLCSVVRIWSRWPESMTERRTDCPSRQRRRASEGKCWGVWTHFHSFAWITDFIDVINIAWMPASSPVFQWVSPSVFQSVNTSQWAVVLGCNPSLHQVWWCLCLLWWVVIRG